MRLNNKIALIAGSASDIGEGIVRLFTAEGARVLLKDINDNAEHLLAKNLSTGCHYQHLDVSSSVHPAAARTPMVQQYLDSAADPMALEKTYVGMQPRATLRTYRKSLRRCYSSPVKRLAL